VTTEPAFLGAATEARLAVTFADGPLATAKAVADCLHVDEKTLRAMTERGQIASVLVGAKGTTRRYTETDVRAFLSGPRAPVQPKLEAQPCPPRAGSPRKRPGAQIIGFSAARKAARQHERLSS